MTDVLGVLCTCICLWNLMVMVGKVKGLQQTLRRRFVEDFNIPRKLWVGYGSFRRPLYAREGIWEECKLRAEEVFRHMERVSTLMILFINVIILTSALTFLDIFPNSWYVLITGFSLLFWLWGHHFLWKLEKDFNRIVRDGKRFYSERTQ